ncbi:MAG: 30S ribosomal protein S2 [Chloroflexota bacterium]|nr:30S ribosomal protein S2 [Chloroflexota bacterium]
MKALLEAGVHFGHQKKRWNPKMRNYIFTEKNGIHVIDLNQTVPLLDEAYNFVSNITSNGGRILFVGTKKQAQEVVANEATRSGQFYINRRWLGGTLTNFVTIRSRLRTLKSLQNEAASGGFELLPNQEAAAKRQELERLERTLGGMRDMSGLPGAIFVVDPKREHLAIQEARRLKIPVIAITDTNCDPDVVDYIIPGNDDAIRSVRLITSAIADAAIQGSMQAEIRVAEDEMDFGAAEVDEASEAIRAAEPVAASEAPAPEAASETAAAPAEVAAPADEPATAEVAAAE